LTIKNVSLEQTDERATKALAFGLGVASRGTCHMRSRPSVDVVGYPREILKEFYGGEVGKDFKDYTGKGRMVWWHELFNAVADSVGICRFAGIFTSINAIGYLDLSRLLACATGLDLADRDLIALGERVYTTERMLLANAGISRKDDYLPPLYYEVPVPAGPSEGEYIDRTRYDQMLDEYYRLHGWDQDGIPTKETLERLELPTPRRNESE
jgi:aldehyde:ferredoxin oxidoreductase